MEFLKNLNLTQKSLLKHFEIELLKNQKQQSIF